MTSEFVYRVSQEIMAHLVAKSVGTDGMGNTLYQWDSPEALAKMAIENAKALEKALHNAK